MIERFVALDLETTGLDPEKDSIIEVGAARIVNRRITGKFCALINPGRPLPERIVKLTGITDTMLASAPAAEPVLFALYDFLGTDILLGHNILFDYSFLKKYYSTKKMEFNRMGMDTLRLARKFCADRESKSLSSMCGYYHITNANAHRAYDDAVTAAGLFFKLAEEFGEADAGAFDPESLEFKPKKQGPITAAQKKYLNDLIKYHRMNINGLLEAVEKTQVEQLTKSEASRMIDRIILEFGKMV
ncbi:3'-5' exonuclease [Anaerolentibacter hominis]|uniref:3'-5' exonuclease n=1 Tax=Anaerolentibacter hominis TaxID=3079009 RepID=UPI0031B830AD